MWDPDYSKDGQQRAPLLGGEKKYYYEQRAPTAYQQNSHSASSHQSTPQKRAFHDVLFGLLFLVTIAAFVGISIIGFTRGEPDRLLPSGQYPEMKHKEEYWFQNAVAQAKEDRYIILGALGLAIVLGFVWIQLLRTFTKLFIYVTLFVGIGLVAATATYLLVLGQNRGKKSLRIAAFIVYGMVAVLFLIILLLRKKIALTCALFKECCKGVQHNPAILIICAVIVAAFAGFSVYWFASFVYLFSVPDKNVEITERSYSFNTKLHYLLYFQVFAFYWISAFISAVFQVTVAGSISHWYFARDASGYKSEYGAPAIQSLIRAVTKNFGSIALGSLILAIVQFINFLLSQAKRTHGRQNRLARIVIGCVQCCARCLEALVRFVNRFTYIWIGIHGDGFFSSAKNCYQLISKNMFSVAVVDFLGYFVLFVGRLLGTAASTFFTIALLHHLHRPITGITISIVVVSSYLVFNLFSKIIHTGVDTVFVSYMIDLEKNRESGALYISPELHHMLQTKADAKHINDTN